MDTFVPTTLADATRRFRLGTAGTEEEEPAARLATRPGAPNGSDDDNDEEEVEVVEVAVPQVAAVPEEEPEGEERGEAARRQQEQDAEDTRNRAAAQRMSGGVAVSDHKAAHRRLMRDLQSLQKTLASDAGAAMGISAHPIDDDLFHWRAVIAGPEDSVWEGGLFKLDLKFSDYYPLQPPTVRLVTKNVFHPNVYVDGNICLDTLRSCWSPTLDVETLLLSITSLLSDPNPRSAANGHAAKLLVEDRPAYDEKVRTVVEESLNQSFSDIDDEGEEEE